MFVQYSKRDKVKIQSQCCGKQQILKWNDVLPVPEVRNVDQSLIMSQLIENVATDRRPSNGDVILLNKVPLKSILGHHRVPIRDSEKVRPFR